MVTIIYLIFNIISTYSIYTFIDNFLKSRRVSPSVILCAYILHYLIITLVYFHALNVTFNVVTNLCLGVLMGFLYNTSTFKRILASAFINMLAIACDEFAVIVLSIFSKSTYNMITSGSYLTITGIIITMSTLFVSVHLVKPLFHDHNNDLPLSYWLAVFLIPSGSIYILHSMNAQYMAGGIQTLPFILITIFILFAINILIFFLYNKLIRDEELKYDNILLRQQNEAYENQRLLIQQFQQSLHAQRHDMRGYFSMIKQLALNEDQTQLFSYLDTLIGNTNEIATAINSGNTLIDAMVNSNIYLSALQNIEFLERITISRPLNINDVDLTTVLYNLFNNAQEACIKLPAGKRRIWLTIHDDHRILTINVTNTYDPAAIDLRDGKAHTTKTDKNLHGIGLKRIQQTAEKYSGEFHYHTLEKDGISLFHAHVAMKPK